MALALFIDIEAIDHQGRVVGYTYDAVGNRLTMKDANNHTTSYTYDALNRVTSIAFQDGTQQTYAYDQGANGIGRLSSITETDPASQVTSVLRCGSCPTTATTSLPAYGTAHRARSAGFASGTSASVVSTASMPYAFATISAVCCARTSGLLAIRSSSGTSVWRPSATSAIFRRPSFVSGRSVSGWPVRANVSCSSAMP